MSRLKDTSDFKALCRRWTKLRKHIVSWEEALHLPMTTPARRSSCVVCARAINHIVSVFDFGTDIEAQVTSELNPAVLRVNNASDVARVFSLLVTALAAMRTRINQRLADLESVIAKNTKSSTC